MNSRKVSINLFSHLKKWKAWRDKEDGAWLAQIYSNNQAKQMYDFVCPFEISFLQTKLYLAWRAQSLSVITWNSELHVLSIRGVFILKYLSGSSQLFPHQPTLLNTYIIDSSLYYNKTIFPDSRNPSCTGLMSSFVPGIHGRYLKNNWNQGCIIFLRKKINAIPSMIYDEVFKSINWVWHIVGPQ